MELLVHVVLDCHPNGFTPAGLWEPTWNVGELVWPWCVSLPHTLARTFLISFQVAVN